MMTMQTLNYSGSRLDASLQLGQQIADRWGVHALMVQMARDITKQWNTRTRLDEARAIQHWVNMRVRYVPDPHGAEMISDPLTTLKNGGDCDDQAVLAAALLQAHGHDARIAAVQWQGRTAPTHAVVVDLTAQCVVDPISTGPDAWPPQGYKVQFIKYLNKAGQMETMTGLFSKAFKAIAKPFQKIFPAKTVLGKIVDPLGLTDPKRNLNLAGRIADVAGTAAALAVGGYALGAASGASGGFWATTGAGFKVAGAAALKAGSSLASGVGSALKFLGPAAAMLGGGGGAVPQPVGMTADQAAAWQAYGGDAGAGYGGSSGGYSGGGGGAGGFAPGMEPPPGMAGTTDTGKLMTGLALVVVAGVAVYAISRKRKKKGA